MLLCTLFETQDCINDLNIERYDADSSLYYSPCQVKIISPVICMLHPQQPKPRTQYHNMNLKTNYTKKLRINLLLNLSAVKENLCNFGRCIKGNNCFVFQTPVVTSLTVSTTSYYASCKMLICSHLQKLLSFALDAE